MKKNLIVVALVAAASLSAASAFAAPEAGGAGQIKFNGTILDEACTIVNTVSNPLDVDLGTYGKNEFLTVGHATAKKRVDIQLTGCPATVTSAAVNFDGTSDSVNGNLLAIDSTVAGAATGVAIQLYDLDQSPLALHTVSQSSPLATGDNTLTYFAAYKSTAAAVTGGPANGVANFSIDYN